MKRISAPPSVPSIHVKRSAELWLEVFQSSLSSCLENELEHKSASASPASVVDVTVSTARLIADAALDEFEKRWPGVKL